MTSHILKLAVSSGCLFIALCTAAIAEDTPTFEISVTVDRGEDRGQNFGSLFEIESKDGQLTIGAGFPNSYNTRYRADRHALQFFVRLAEGTPAFQVEALPRPNNLCGTYLYGRDGQVYSTYGGLGRWNSDDSSWASVPEIGGTQETMRVGDGLLAFGDSEVIYEGRTILARPTRGSYQLFFYANGYLCFYHVNRGDRGYRPYENDQNGFSKLYACPWEPGEERVDLSQAVVMTLPVVGETTFAWGQLGSQIVTGSNIGGFYVFEDRKWRTVLEPQLGVSYQLYSTMAFHDRLLMGQYPTGRIFSYDGKELTELSGWPPKLDGVSGSAREAQTTAICGGEALVGVWPWAELWRYNPSNSAWNFIQRMFEHPELSNRVTHPYDAENQGNPVGNLWGQRITSLVTNGSDLFISTSAKYPAEWQPDVFPFLAKEDKWQSYGRVYRLTWPGQLSAPTRWTKGPTTFDFELKGNRMSVRQDGQLIGSAQLTDDLVQAIKDKVFKAPRWGAGIYGPFAGRSLSGAAK